MSSAPDNGPIKVLYIAGAGRSGSTVLNALLSMHPDVEGVGELVNLPRLGSSKEDFCSCGVLVRECPFWSEVRQHWEERAGKENVSQYLALRTTLIQNSQRRFITGFRAADTASPGFKRFAELTTALYRSIQNVSGKSVIVDSSKAPLLAFFLSQIPDIDLRLIHLVRDVRGVTWSFSKAFEKDPQAGVQRKLTPTPAWRTAVQWWRINAHAEWVAKQTRPGGAKRVRYEDLLANPGKVLSEIGHLFGVDYEGIDPHNAALEFSHTVAGNRVRTSQNNQLRRTDEWAGNLRARDKRVVETVAALPLARYGYKG